MLVRCCLLFVVGVWCFFCIVSCGVLRGCCLCLLLVVRWLLSIVCLFVVCWLRFVCGVLLTVWCLVFDDCYLLVVVCSMLFIGCCVSCVGWRLLFGVV